MPGVMASAARNRNQTTISGAPLEIFILFMGLKSALGKWRMPSKAVEPELSTHPSLYGFSEILQLPAWAAEGKSMQRCEQRISKSCRSGNGVPIFPKRPHPPVSVAGLGYDRKFNTRQDVALGGDHIHPPSADMLLAVQGYITPRSCPWISNIEHHCGITAAVDRIDMLERKGEFPFF